MKDLWDLQRAGAGTRNQTEEGPRGNSWCRALHPRSRHGTTNQGKPDNVFVSLNLPPIIFSRSQPRVYRFPEFLLRSRAYRLDRLFERIPGCFLVWYSLMFQSLINSIGIRVSRIWFPVCDKCLSQSRRLICDSQFLIRGIDARKYFEAFYIWLLKDRYRINGIKLSSSFYYNPIEIKGQSRFKFRTGARLIYWRSDIL